MKTLKIGIINTGLLILIAALLLCLPAGELRADYKSIKDDSSPSVFSPGYINASKQQTERIISQSESSSKEGLWQKTMNYLQGKVANDVEKETSQNLVKPELKMKKGGSESKPATKIAQAANAKVSTPIPAEVMNAATNLDGSGSASRVTALSNGNFVITWSAGNGEGATQLYFSILNSSGETVVRQTEIGPASAYMTPQGVNTYDLGNGKFILAYEVINDAGGDVEAPDGWTSTVTLDIYNSGNGNLEASKELQGSKSFQGSTSSAVYSIATLADGTFAVLTSDNDWAWTGVTSYNIQTFNSNLEQTGSLSSQQFGYANADALISLGGDKFAVTAHDDQYQTYLVSMDSGFNRYGDPTLVNGYIEKIASLGDGRFALGLNNGEGLSVFTYNLEDDGYGQYSLVAKNTFDLVGSNSGMSNMAILNNGDVVVTVGAGTMFTDPSGGGPGGWLAWENSDYLEILKSDGTISPVDVSWTLDMPSYADVVPWSDYRRVITQIITSSDTFQIVKFEDQSKLIGGAYIDNVKTGTQEFSSTGMPLLGLNQPTPIISNAPSLIAGSNLDGNYDYNVNSLYSESIYNALVKNELDRADSDKRFGLSDAKSLSFGKGQVVSPGDLLAVMASHLADNSALSPYTILSERGDYANIMATLSNILKNPTEDQKSFIDTISALLTDINKAKEDSAEEVITKKQEDDLIKAVAAVLLSQAIPDLLSPNDMADVKGIFSDMAVEKGRILKDYEEACKPYYEEVAKDIAKNFEILQTNNIISKKMGKKDLQALSRSEIDRIIEKLKKQEKKPFEFEYILQQEAKYRKAYLEPGKKFMEERIRLMIASFTSKINSILNSASDKKK